MDSSKNIKRILYNVSKTTGKGSICIYYSHSGSVKRWNSGVKLPADRWDKTKSTYRRGSLDDNDAAIVDNLYNNIITLITDYQYKYNQLPPIDYLEAGLAKPEIEPEVKEKSFFDLFQEWMVRNNSVEPETKKSHDLALKSLKEFCKKIKYDLTLNNFNFDFIERYNDWQLNTKNLKSGTLKLRLDAFKTFTKWLNDMEIEHNIKPNVWKKIKPSKPDLVCLERHELKDIIDYEPKTVREQKTKDFILWLAFTGMRQIDTYQINKHCIKDGCLEFYPKKTKKHNIKAIVPLTKITQEIMDRYKGKAPTQHRVLQTKYIQDFCAKIPSLQKEILHEGKLKPKYSVLSSHKIGRKTFYNICLEKGLQLSTVMGFTGSTSVDTVLRSYIDKHRNNKSELDRALEL